MLVIYALAHATEVDICVTTGCSDMRILIGSDSATHPLSTNSILVSESRRVYRQISLVKFDFKNRNILTSPVENNNDRG